MEEKKRKQNHTPEERFDEAILYESMYGFAIWTVLFLFIGIAFFIGLMPIGLSISLAGTFTMCLVALVLSPLLLDNYGGRVTRRISICNYFPARKKEFICSKLKYVTKYGIIFWLCSLAAQLIAVPFWNFQKLFIYQGMLIGFMILWTGIYLFVGSCGKK